MKNFSTSRFQLVKTRKFQLAGAISSKSQLVWVILV